MKRLFLLFGVSACAILPVVAQQSQHSGNVYDVSVFADSRNMRPAYKSTNETIRQLKSVFPGWYIQGDAWTNGFRDLNGPAISIPGSSLEDKAWYCMSTLLTKAGVNAADWQLSGQMTNKKGFTFLYFSQQVAGHQVTFAKMNFKFTADGRLTSITSKTYGQPDTKLVAERSETEALAIALADLSGISVTRQEIKGIEWFPVPANGSYVLRPAYSFAIDATRDNALPLQLTGYVDAITGALLYRDNAIKDAIDMTVKGTVHKNGYINPTSDEPLANLAVQLNADPTVYYTDALGYMTAATPTVTPDTATIPLKGKWCNVIALASSSVTPTFNNILTTTGTSFLFPTLDPSSSRHINAYFHVNRAHDHMKTFYPSFTTLDAPMPTYIDRTGAGTCNAFYSGFTINFLAAGGGCISFAEAGDVVYHEYGHGISDKFYAGITTSMRNGALNEGNSDIWGISITHNPILGEGTSTTGYIRRYDMAPKVYPANIVGEVHADGEIIAGAWWDVAVNMGGKVDSMAELFASTYYDTPDGPTGTEGDVYFDVLMSALKNDDDDLDLSTGTPHFDEITKAFARHGIYLLSDAEIGHNELDNQPAMTAIPVSATLGLTNPSFFQSLKLVYKPRGGTSDTLTMTTAGSFIYMANIPGQPEGTIIDYFFIAKDLLDNNGKYFPLGYNPASASNQVTIPHQFGVGLSAMRTVDFETPLSADWQVGLSTDNAATGRWIVAVPIPSFATSGLAVQTGNDHTSGSGQCLVTGNASASTVVATAQSVKNGLTTVVTPLYDLSAYTKPIVAYHRWFGNDRGRAARKDNWQVQITNATSSVWKDVENTYQSDYNWRRRIFHTKDYIVTSSVRLRFWAKDILAAGSTTSSLVEGAVDDFIIYEGVEGLISSVDETAKQTASIYPNPANDAIHVVLPSANYKTIAIDIYDVTGRHLSSINTDHNNTQYEINMKHFTAGQYLVVVKLDKLIQSHTITIQHP